jgi:hypothetical protein
MKILAFWNIAPRNLVEVDLRFRGAYCLHHQSDEFCRTVTDALRKELHVFPSVTRQRFIGGKMFQTEVEDVLTRGQGCSHKDSVLLTHSFP